MTFAPIIKGHEGKPMIKKMTVFVVTIFIFAGIHVSSAQQSAKVPRIGVLLPSPTGFKTYFGAFRESLKELGYIESQNVADEYR